MRFGTIVSIPDRIMRGVAADVLTPTGAVIPATATLEEAEQRMVTLGTSELYVLSADGQLAGILPDYEVLKLRLAGELNRRRVSEVMSAAEPRVVSTTPIAELAVSMRLSCHRRLPVIANGRLIGEVTRRNVLRHLHAAAESSDAQFTTSFRESEARRQSLGPPRFLKGAGKAAASATDRVDGRV
ncbi:MAG: CBS domain-containing protein [Planctomycetaceae bacterium]|nr:CBS domain-containing protein [Planctomycetaceae bacterium]